MKIKNSGRFLLATLVILTGFCACFDKPKTGSKPGFVVSASLGGSYRVDTSDIVYVVGKLHNRSADTISFLSMTCSWDDSWKITSPNMSIVKNICFSNVPILIKLGPNESMLNYIPVRLLKPYQDLKNEKFLVGFNLVKADTVEFTSAIKALAETNNYFWSDTIHLNELSRFNTITKEN